MANNSKKELIQAARRWVEQEKAWDDAVYVSSVTPGSIPVLSSSKAAALQSLYDKYNTCARCALGTSRLKFVFGVGNPDARVLLIGEGPGYQEDHQGEPFVGRSGQLLDKMLEAIGLSRKTVYIANIVKCHPMVNPKDPESHGNDRPPTPEEVTACSPILQQQIAIIQPRVILTLGSPSTKTILGTTEGISKVRGKLYPMQMSYYKAKTEGVDLLVEKKEDYEGLTSEQLAPLQTIQVLPTYHPAALLRNPNLKKDAWEDLKLLKKTIENPS
jgi:uracil-DNA glycosylase family 4